jgi:hypothetical protein
VKIGAVFNSDLTDVHHRVVVPLRELGRRGHEVVFVQPDHSGHVAPERLASCDVVLIHRRAERDVLSCVDALLDRGVAITWDTDDPSALLPLDDSVPPELCGHRARRELRGQVEMLRRASVVTTATEAVAERCRGSAPGEVVVIEDYLSDEEYVWAPRAHSGVAIGWIADEEQVADAERVGVLDVLRRLLTMYQHMSVVTIGAAVDLGHPDRTTCHRHVPFEVMARLIRQFDVGIAPVSELPTSAARSRTTVKQYAASGVPWIASARHPYLGLGEGQGGLLVSDDGWEHAILALSGARFRRRQLRRLAEEWGKTQHIACHADRWESVFTTAAAALHAAA